MNEWEFNTSGLFRARSFVYIFSYAKNYFNTNGLVPYTTIPECIEAVANGKVDLAVVPIENALEGSVPLTIDYLFHEADLFVIAEVLSPIEQHLMVHQNHSK